MCTTALDHIYTMSASVRHADIWCTECARRVDDDDDGARKDEMTTDQSDDPEKRSRAITGGREWGC